MPVRALAICSAAAVSCLALWARPLAAQDRPSEDQMFGSAPEAQTPAPGAQPEPEAGAALPTATTPAAQAAASTTETARDDAILGGAASDPGVFGQDAAPEDPLKIGGQVYLRAQASGLEGQDLDEYAFSTPTLLDLYLDARPNDRVRAFVLGRMNYDPTLAERASESSSAAGSGTAGSGSLSSLFATRGRGPYVALDQLWLRFDVDHTVFVTAGKQHVRWGTGRFWSPADYLHIRHRNPLDVFDARTGTTMIKLHLPVESKAWNFYAYGLTEGGDTTPTLDRIAAAARAEIVLGNGELGVGMFGRKGGKPKFAADLSLGVGDFDVYGELSVLDQRESDRVRYEPDAEIPPQDEPPAWQSPVATAAARLPQVVDAIYPVYRREGYRPQAVVGVNYSHLYNDNDTFTVGAEYFYNALGYGSPSAYPGLVLPHQEPLSNPATFFYLGKHYAALFVSFPAPFSLDLHTFTLSTLGNLSDLSFITRLDYALVVLTHLRFEAFGAVRYGEPHGEFRFGVASLDIGGTEFSRAPALFDFGVGLRMDI
jgi:hypothetical protein